MLQSESQQIQLGPLFGILLRPIISDIFIGGVHSSTRVRAKVSPVQFGNHFLRPVRHSKLALTWQTPVFPLKYEDVLAPSSLRCKTNIPLFLVQSGDLLRINV